MTDKKIGKENKKYIFMCAYVQLCAYYNIQNI